MFYVKNMACTYLMKEYISEREIEQVVHESTEFDKTVFRSGAIVKDSMKVCGKLYNSVIILESEPIKRSLHGGIPVIHRLSRGSDSLMTIFELGNFVGMYNISLCLCVLFLGENMVKPNDHCPPQ